MAIQLIAPPSILRLFHKRYGNRITVEKDTIDMAINGTLKRLRMIVKFEKAKKVRVSYQKKNLILIQVSDPEGYKGDMFKTWEGYKIKWVTNNPSKDISDSPDRIDGPAMYRIVDDMPMVDDIMVAHPTVDRTIIITDIMNEMLDRAILSYNPIAPDNSGES